MRLQFTMILHYIIYIISRAVPDDDEFEIENDLMVWCRKRAITLTKCIYSPCPRLSLRITKAIAAWFAFRNLSPARRETLGDRRVEVTNAWNAQLSCRDNVPRLTEGSRNLLSILPMSARHFRCVWSLINPTIIHVPILELSPGSECPAINFPGRALLILLFLAYLKINNK